MNLDQVYQALPRNLIFNLHGVLCKIVYVNRGQNRITFTPIAIIAKDPKTPNAPPFFITLDQNKKLSAKDMDIWLYENHNQKKPRGYGQNPDNVTLDVHKGSFSANAKIKPKK